MTKDEAAKALQRRVGVEPDGDIGLKTIAAINRELDRSAAPARPRLHIAAADIAPKQSVRAIRTIAVHCSATKEGQPFNAKDIDGWHRRQGWNEIGYNAVVLLDGTIEKGRDEAKTPSHAQGHNADSIAICYIGGTDAAGKPKDTRTPEQKAALRKWLELKKSQYPAARIQGHHDYPGVTKACPSFAAKAEYADL